MTPPSLLLTVVGEQRGGRGQGLDVPHELVVAHDCLPKCPLTPTSLVALHASPGLGRTEKHLFIWEVSTSCVASSMAGLFVHLSGFPPKFA